MPMGMKSPAELIQKLRHQWDSRLLRESRLLGGATVWPVDIAIGKPSPSVMRSDLDAVMRHVQAWRNISIGQVVWDSVSYRATAEPVEVPRYWRLDRPTDWVKACGDSLVRAEFETLANLVEQTDAIFHSLFIRRRSLWRGRPLVEVIQAARLALVLEPGYAKGRPLRTLSVEGIDTKFFERNASLVTRLLDVRFDDEVSRLGLEVFLGAFFEGDHWLLLVDMDGNLLPFQKQRVSSAELASADLPGERVLIIENESCLHQLPDLADTIAILGAGFDLGWTSNPCLCNRQVGYWGDIDTWGLQFLAEARENLPSLTALLMDEATFDAHIDSAVHEPVAAGAEASTGLYQVEKSLYKRLLNQPNGRLEQEFIPTETVQAAIRQWFQSSH